MECALQAQYNYAPFGERTKIAGSGADADFGFAGMYNHARSGLNLTLFRAYAPSLARWLSRDPLEEAAGTNLYAYVSNNGVNGSDPLGLAPSLTGSDPVPWSSIANGAAIGRAVGGPGNLVLNQNLKLVPHGSYLLFDAEMMKSFYSGQGGLSRMAESMIERGLPNGLWTPTYNNAQQGFNIESERLWMLGGPKSESCLQNARWPRFSPHRSAPPFRLFQATPSFGGGGAGVGIGGLGGPIFSNYIFTRAFGAEI